MKKIILSLFIVTLFGCSKKDLVLSNSQLVTPPVVTKPTPNIPKGFYVGKTSYELKTAKSFVNIDSLRIRFGIFGVGRWNGNNNYGFVYVDMNNDGFEDIFYPYSSDGKFNSKPDVFLFNGTTYTKDNSMLPADYDGNENTRKTIVADFNNDSLPDLFLINHGYEDPTLPYFIGETNTLLLSDKVSGKYKLGDNSTFGEAFWHGGASGDINKDGNMDIIISSGDPILFLGDGKGGFSRKNVDFKIDGARPYITIEVMDLDKDGNHDIIMSGLEGRITEGVISKSVILLNKGMVFERIDITEPNTSGWAYVMDIAAEDIDNDGIKEIIFTRTQDDSGVVYNGYFITIYKEENGPYKDVTENFIKNNKYTENRSYPGYWMYQIHLKKEIDGLYAIYGYVSEQSKIQYWKQNPTTKIFE